MLPPQLQGVLLHLVSVDILQGSELLNESLVLIFKHGHAVFKAFDVFLLLSSTLTSSFPGNDNSGHEEKHSHHDQAITGGTTIQTLGLKRHENKVCHHVVCNTNTSLQIVHHVT